MIFKQDIKIIEKRFGYLEDVSYLYGIRNKNSYETQTN